MTVKLNGFEQIANSNNLDSLPRAIDSSTTVDGLIKIIAEEYLFKEDVLRGIKFFKGQVLRVVKLSAQDSSFLSYPMQIQAAIQKNSGTIDAYIVRVPGIHSILPVPKTFGTEASQEMDAKVINLYKPYFISDQFGIQYGLGDIVEVTFGNMNNFSDGRIVQLVTKFNSQSNSVGGQDVKKAFNSPPEVEDLDLKTDPNDPDVKMSKYDAWENKKNIGKIPVKPIAKYGDKDMEGPYVLRADIANKFLAMQNQYNKETSKLLKISDAFRSDELQIERKEKYKDLASSPASMGGGAPHQTGKALDISTESSYNSHVYKWLNKNAGEYDFYNAGRYYKKGRPQGEPWHWENYLPNEEKYRNFYEKEKKRLALEANGQQKIDSASGDDV